MKKISKSVFITLALMFLFVPVLVMAQLPNPTIPVGGSALTLTEVQNLITTIARFLIVISLIVAVIFIVWGGIAYMVAGSNEEASGNAKKRIINGIIGAAIVLAVGVIMQTLAGLIARTFFN